MSDSEEEFVEKQLKIAFVGDTDVGKSSIIKRFCQDEFTRQSNPTVGADFYTKHIILPGHQGVTLIISDIGGQELGGTMLDKYLYNVNVIVFVYDITNSASFDSLSAWFDSVSSLIPTPIRSAVFGNKCDLDHQRAIRIEHVQQFVNQCNLHHFSVSARTGEYLNASVMELVAKHLGVRLSAVEKEHHHVVKARLVPPTAAGKRPATKQESRRKELTAVCSIQ
ncbi:hypothetical protein FQA39_LY01348 [Lamprigera yunnana]|nr:hypothetical protein FQA39_LY01348 [Lamprigera yunnana]